MYLESEVYLLLLIAFVLVIVLEAAILLILYLRSHNKHILWFVGHIVFLCVAFYYFFRAICFLPVEGFSMYSEIQSLNIGYAGVFWFVSMLFMLMGIYQLLRKRKVVYQF